MLRKSPDQRLTRSLLKKLEEEEKSMKQTAQQRIFEEEAPYFQQTEEEDFTEEEQLFYPRSLDKDLDEDEEEEEEGAPQECWADRCLIGLPEEYEERREERKAVADCNQ